MQLMKKISTAALAGTLAIATAMPVMAAPLSAPSSPAQATALPLLQVQYRRGDYDDGPRFKGYKGSREHRRGWRRNDNGWWYPLAAFGLGAAIGSQLAQPQVRGGASAHVDWCYARYRSYRAWDNTYQPYGGPRRECYSPYG